MARGLPAPSFLDPTLNVLPSFCAQPVASVARGDCKATPLPAVSPWARPYSMAPARLAPGWRRAASEPCWRDR
eukprot:742772-Alexandrium_andersonii.AAC.1